MASDRDLRIRVLLAAMDKASGPLKAIREESRKAGSAIRDTRADLVKLEKAQADLKGFRDLKRGLKDTGTQLADARAKAAQLARQIEQTDKPTQALTREFARAKREAADLGRTFDRQQRELQETRDRLQAAGLSTRNLVADERRLAGELRATNARLAEQKRHFQDLQRNAPRRLAEARATAQADREAAAESSNRAVFVGRAGMAAAAAGAYGALRLGREAVVDAANYERVLTSIGQKANLTREQAQRLGETLRSIAPEVSRSPQAMAGAVDTLAGLGLLGQFDNIKDPEQRFRTLERATAAILTASGRAATAYDAAEDDLVRSIGAGVQNLQIPAERAKRILDIMAAGDNAGAFSMKAMAVELPSLTGAWGALGQTGDKALGQLIAGLETARMIAGTDEEAANNLKNLILKLNSAELAKNFSEFGVNLPAALKQAKREGRDLLEVIAELTNKATKGDNDKIAQIFTDQQAQLAIVALITKLKEYRGLRDQVMKSDGTVDRQFLEREKDTATKWDKLKSQWSNRMIGWGKELKPLTDGILDSLLDKEPKVPAAKNVTDLMRIAARYQLAQKAATSGMPEWFVKASNPTLTAAAFPTNTRFWQQQNAVARQYQAEALGDQRRAGQQSLAEADRVRGQMRAKLGNSAESQGWGRNIMLGLQVGMSATVPGLIANVLSIGARIKSAFRGDMQIKSPSRVFMGYGRFMTQGLALGIDGGSADAQAAMQRLSRGLARPPAINYLSSATSVPARGAAAPGGTTAASAAPTINFHGPITIQLQQQPGEDGAALARQIQGELARHAQAAAARRASSYEDLD